MDPRVAEILETATDIQRRYVKARLVHPDVAKAARSLGIARSTPHKWPNLVELEEAVTLLYNDVIEAAKMALEDLALEAVRALKTALGDGGTASVQAARAILDRIGLPAQSNVDVTSGGETIRAVVYIPDNGRDRD